MRRTSRRRLPAAALLVASVVFSAAAAPAAIATAAPTAAVRTAAVRTANVPAADAGRSGPCADDDCPHSSLGPELTARLDQAIDDVRRQAHIPGAVVGLWMPGRGSYVRASGVADTATGAPMRADSFVRIGSETKTFTVTALLQLVDEHRVRLDDPISAYVAGVPGGRVITLRELAEMRSGLFPYTSDPDFIHTLLSDPHRSFTPREVLAYGFRHANTFAPAARFQYSNSNLVLLGLVIEKVTGRPLGDVIRDRVLRPAGLPGTQFPRSAALPDPHPHGYTDQTLTGATADATDWNPSWAWAAGAMFSDLHDLRRWAVTVATGRLLSPATQAQRLAMLPTGIAGLGYGLGLFATNGWIGHNGSIPGYETVTVYLPETKATLVLMMNTDSQTGGQEPSTLLARAITGIVTPDHVYDSAISPR